MSVIRESHSIYDQLTRANRAPFARICTGLVIACVLSFAVDAPLAAEGEYLRDIRAAGNSLADKTWGASWEAVEITAAQLHEATCWMNLYHGSGGRIEGVVRVVFDERTADIPFGFPAIAGDGAKGRISRHDNPCWIEIGLDELPFK